MFEPECLEPQQSNIFPTLDTPYVFYLGNNSIIFLPHESNSIFFETFTQSLPLPPNCVLIIFLHHCSQNCFNLFFATLCKSFTNLNRLLRPKFTQTIRQELHISFILRNQFWIDSSGKTERIVGSHPSNLLSLRNRFSTCENSTKTRMP